MTQPRLSNRKPIVYNLFRRAAIHQLTNMIGMVTPTAHQNGKNKSATKPRTAKLAQKTFFSMSLF